ncbi:hypothetical protein ABH14_09950 [Brevibacillus brevis]|uniref:hypothetical protein n=1 Tax=Brevibacillus brevis TaxID=1393 RepID=UPI0018FF92B8|nr:hypothetical protein [Brevibacillus brevis]MBH0330113.1 hypothetical protein [Brevibacillus brevis]
MEVKKIDIKWFLYRYRQFVEAKKNTERAIEVLNKKILNPPHDENWFIRGKGGIPTSFQERETILDDENENRVRQLSVFLSDLSMIISAIEGAHRTLNKEQSDLIRLRYFEGRDVNNVAAELLCDMRRYYRIHGQALEAMSICLKALEFTFSLLHFDEYIGKVAMREKIV